MTSATVVRSARILRNYSTMADAAKAGPLRPMKFPYTISAKIAQFPWKHYFGKQFIWKYYIGGVLVCIPLFKKISNLSNSPENVAKWAEIRRKEAAEHH
ncbi:hypothetical protein QE152_g15462 [Popillia japonica]|uniref:Uncharacterized protein n=1 Tax=Popillia japonica TaxID=7064 RepID=A0AAW1L5D8_POPJA